MRSFTLAAFTAGMLLGLAGVATAQQKSGPTSAVAWRLGWVAGPPLPRVLKYWNLLEAYMKTVLATLLLAAVLTVRGGAAFVHSGAFNVAATEPHWSASRWVMEKTRMRSIQVRAAGLTTPSGYDEASKLASAAGHFSKHRATYHGGPGIKPSVWAEGMYPAPPNLKEAAFRYTPGELFWILKNGIKMSAMPSMASDGDEML